MFCSNYLYRYRAAAQSYKMEDLVRVTGRGEGKTIRYKYSRDLYESLSRLIHSTWLVFRASMNYTSEEGNECPLSDTACLLPLSHLNSEPTRNNVDDRKFGRGTLSTLRGVLRDGAWAIRGFLNFKKSDLLISRFHEIRDPNFLILGNWK